MYDMCVHIHINIRVYVLCMYVIYLTSVDCASNAVSVKKGFFLLFLFFLTKSNSGCIYDMCVHIHKKIRVYVLCMHVIYPTSVDCASNAESVTTGVAWR